MELYGLLIDYNYCSGCRTCMVACQKAHEKYDITKQGLIVTQIGPIDLQNGKWQFDNIALHTMYCNHCHERIKEGKTPACALHCQSGCITFGPAKSLLEKMTGPKQVLFTL